MVVVAATVSRSPRQTVCLGLLAVFLLATLQQTVVVARDHRRGGYPSATKGNDIFLQGIYIYIDGLSFPSLPSSSFCTIVFPSCVHIHTYI